MKSIKMKIRPKFLSLIRNNTKKHEYRLASPKYASVNIGDRLILISNQNHDDYAIVYVEKIFRFPDWGAAFKDRWRSDFNGLYDNYEDLIKECYKFYSISDVKQYGIEVFEIKNSPNNIFEKARYLFDTNIIVQRESMNNCSSEVTLAFNTIDRLQGVKLFHPITKTELSKYAEDKIKEPMLKKLTAYEELVPTIEHDSFFDEIVGRFSLDENSKNDNEILLQAYSGRVDFLITEDRTILKKAHLLYLDDKVFSTNAFLTKVDEMNPKLVDYDALSVKKVKIGTLNFNDSFFNSLREDYGGINFNKWLEKKSEEEAYVFSNKEGLQGFLYLKVENEEENYSFFKPVLPPKKRLKIGTFKINSTGIRLGERFLKIVFDNALKRQVEEVYVTMFKNKRQEVMNLKKMMEEWGFVEKGINTKNDEVYLIKDMMNYNENKPPKFNYPLIMKSPEASYLPIYPRYHIKLFPDSHLTNEKVSYFDDACSYAIEKIYVTRWNKVALHPGALLFVYRMADVYKKYRSVITGICILNEVLTPNNEDEFIKECKNRSVFSEGELRDFYGKRKCTTIIKLLFLKPITNKVNYNALFNNGLLGDNGPRLTTIITKENYEKLLRIIENGE